MGKKKKITRLLNTGGPALLNYDQITAEAADTSALNQITLERQEAEAEQARLLEEHNNANKVDGKLSNPNDVWKSAKINNPYNGIFGLNDIDPQEAEDHLNDIDAQDIEDRANEEIARQQKLEPQSIVDSELRSTLPEDVYEKYVNDKFRFQELDKKTYGGLFKASLADYLAAKLLEEKNSDGIAETIGKKVYNGLQGLTGSVGSFIVAGLENVLMPSNYFSDKEEVEYNTLKTKLQETSLPVLKQSKAKLQQEYDKVATDLDIDKDKFFYWSMGSDSTYRMDISNYYKRAIQEYDNAIENAGYWSGFFQDRIGVVKIAETARAGIVQSKLDNGEELTPLENQLLIARNEASSAAKTPLNSNSLYELGKGVRSSSEFVAEIWAATGVSAGQTMLGQGINAFAKPLTMPSTYNMAQDTRDENIVVEGNKAILEDVKSAETVSELNKDITIAKSELNKLKAKGNLTLQEQNKIAEWNYILATATEELDKVYDSETKQLRETNKTYGQALLGSYTNQVAENLSEVSGMYIDRFMPSLGSIAASPKVARLLEKNAVRQITESAGKASAKLSAAQAKLASAVANTRGLSKLTPLAKAMALKAGPGRLINSVPSEMLEEVLVNFIPTYGSDYSEKMQELTTPDFYQNVLATTLIIKGQSMAVNSAAHYGKMYTDPEYKKAYNDREDLKKRYEELSTAVTEDAFAERIAMNTAGTFFQNRDYEAEIARLEDPNGANPDNKSQEDRSAEAKRLREISFKNMAFQAITTGTSEDLKKSLTSLIENPDTSESVKQSAETAKNKLATYENIIQQHKARPNATEVVSLAMRQDMLNDTEIYLDQEIEKQSQSLSEAVEAYNKTLPKDSMQYSSESVRQALVDVDSVDDQDFSEYMAGLVSYNTTKGDTKINFGLYQEKGSIQNTKENLKKEFSKATDPARRKEILQEQKDTIFNNILQNVNGSNLAESITQLKKHSIDSRKNVSTLKEAIEKQSIANLTAPTVEVPLESEIPGLSPEALEAFTKRLWPDEIETPEIPVVEEVINASPFNANFEEDEGQVDDPNQVAPAQMAIPLDFLNAGASQAQEAANTGANASRKTATKITGLGNRKKYNSFIPFDNSNDTHNSKVDGLVSIIQAVKASSPTVSFEGLITSLFNSSIGSQNVDLNFDFLREAWNKAVPTDTISPNDGLGVYKKFFVDPAMLQGFQELLQGGNTLPNSTPTTGQINNNVLPQKAGLTTPADIDPATEFPEAFEYDEANARKYKGVGLKLSGLGLNYEEVEDTKNTISEEINETYLPVLDPRNFQPGAEVEFVFHWDYLLDSNNVMSMWSNSDSRAEEGSKNYPKKHKMTTGEYLIRMFKDTPGLETLDKIYAAIEDFKNNPSENSPLFSNPNFLRTIPIGITNKGYTEDTKADGSPADKVLTIGLNDYYWFNRSNIAVKSFNGVPLGSEAQSRIEQNRALNLAAREQILKSGSMISTISQKVVVGTNKPLGESASFNPMIKQFGNTVESFNQNAAMVFVDDKANLYGNLKNGKKTLATIDGVEITTDMVDKDVLEGFLAQCESTSTSGGFKLGRSAIVYKLGLDSKGNTTYGIMHVLNNHSEKQNDMRRAGRVKFELDKLMLSKDTDSASEKVNKAKARAEFKRQFGYEYTKENSMVMKDLMPQVVKNADGQDLLDEKGKKMQRQDISLSGMYKNPSMKTIPDFVSYSSGGLLFNALLEGKEITPINRQEFTLRNLHSTYNFTGVTKDGETRYVNGSQVLVTFDYDPQIINTIGIEEIVKELEATKSNLEKQLQFLELAKQQTNSESQQKAIETKLTAVKQQLEVVKVKTARIQIEMAPKREVGTFTKGDVISEKVQSIRNSVPEIKWTTVENGVETIMPELQGVAILDVAENLVDSSLYLVDRTKPVSVAAVYAVIENQFNVLLNEFKTAGKNVEAKFLEDNKNEILGIDSYENSVKEYLSKLLNIPAVESQLKSAVELQGENLKDFEGASYETNLADSVSFKTKMIFSGIPDNRAGRVFGGMNRSLSLPNALDAVQQALTEVINNDESSLVEALKAKMERNPEDLAFFQILIDRINLETETNPELMKEILYQIASEKVGMKFVMWQLDSQGRMKLAVNDANSNNPLFIKRNDWLEALKTNGLIDMRGGNQYTINEDKAEFAGNLYTILQSQYKEGEINPETFQDYLHLFGISLNSRTIENILNGVNVTDFKAMEKLFQGKNSIVSVLHENLQRAIKNQNNGYALSLVDSTEEYVKKLNLLTYDNSQLNDLIKLDNYIEFIPMNTMYIAGKTLQMYQQTNSISNKIKTLKSGLSKFIANKKDVNNLPEELKNFTETAYMKNSFLMDLMMNQPEEMLKYIESQYVSLEALKENRSSSRDDMGITQLSDQDKLTTMIALMASSEGEYTDDAFEAKYNNELKLRKGLVSFPTISDSSQLPILKTILIQFQDSHFENGEFAKPVLDLLRDTMVLPDLMRVAEYITTIGTIGTGIEGYDAGAMWLTNPAVNVAEVDVTDNQGTERRLPFIEVFRQEIIDFQETLKDVDGNLFPNFKAVLAEKVQDLMDTYAESINRELTNTINSEADTYYTADGKSGEFIDYNMASKGRKGKMLMADTENQKATEDTEKTGFFGKKPRTVALDYVINYMLQQKEIQNMFAGDLAQYFKDSMKVDIPVFSAQQVFDYYYPGQENADVLKEIIGNKSLNSIEDENTIRELIEAFPEIEIGKGMRGDTISQYDIDVISHPLKRLHVNNMFEKVQNNLSKRLKELLSPGNQLYDKKNAKPIVQIVIDDVMAASSTFLYLMNNSYPNHTAQDVADYNKIMEINNTEFPTKSQERIRYLLTKKFEKNMPKIAAYLDITSTDAQEYTSWRDNLDLLLNRGRISDIQYAEISDKLEAQEKDLDEIGKIRDENRLTEKQTKIAVMQPSKPLYSGMVSQNMNGHQIQRYMYVKTSSFPILPELAEKFPNMDNMRRLITRLENGEPDNNVKNSRTVRLAYHSGVKIGAPKQRVSAREIADRQVDLDKVMRSAVTLSRDNFFIQQDKPFKADKNALEGIQDRITRATQFEKILLGDQITKITEAVFPSTYFDDQLLSHLGINPSNGKINGSDLQKVYKEVYKREQKILVDRLFQKLSIEQYSDIEKGKVETMEKLVDLLNVRLSNKQDTQLMELLYVADFEDENGEMDRDIFTKEEIIERGLVPVSAKFKIPLHLTPNSRKFESVLNSVVSNNIAKQTLPGYSFPVASQQGFDYKNKEQFIKDLTRKGLILTKNYDPTTGLKSERNEDGTLKFAQVFIANKFKVYDKYTKQYSYIDLTHYLEEGTNLIDTSKLPEDLLSMFSFRIPTSSHQSGTVIEIAGFLPHTMGDLAIVPKDHTVQIGEDYDIDVRYAYQYNYIRDREGNLKKLEYSDIAEPEMTLNEMRAKLQESKEILWNKYYEDLGGSNAFQKGRQTRLRNREQEYNLELGWNIIVLEDAIENYTEEKARAFAQISEQEENAEVPTAEELKVQLSILMGRMIPKEVVGAAKEKYKKQYKDIKKFLQANFNESKEIWYDYIDAMQQKSNELKVLENNLLGVYKSVYATEDLSVRNNITKVLSTDFAETTASMIDAKRAKKKEYYNIYSPNTQSKVMSAGSAGKMGIGVHSQAVTMHGLLLQLQDKTTIFKDYTDEMEPIPYDIKLGNLTFNGTIGHLSDDSRLLSEYLMISQNAATDNQKLEIMGRRNENPTTIGVFSMMQLAKMENDGVQVNGKDVSYASLFIAQPVLYKYVELVTKYKSSTSRERGNPELMAHETLRESLFKMIPTEMLAVDKNGEIFNPPALSNTVKERIGKALNSQTLYDNIGVDITNAEQAALAIYTLNAFAQIKDASNTLFKVQQISSVGSSGLGISYEGNIDAMNNLMDLSTRKVLITMEGDLKGDRLTFYDNFIGENTVENNELKDGYSMTHPLNEDAIYLRTIPKSDGTFDHVYVVPSTFYAHKIVNTTTLGYNLWKSIFPYENPVIRNQIDSVLAVSGRASTRTEITYDVISHMKDYAYTNNAELFHNGIENERARLFFDNENNESLASYITRLKGNDELAGLFQLPFFKDLRMAIDYETLPSIIKYSSGDMTPLYNMKVDNILRRFMNSKDPLPPKKDGTPMTYESLLKDITIYAVLADQANGAIGFRQYLPVELLEKYSVTNALRNSNIVSDPSVMSFLYNGPKAGLQTFLGKQMDKETKVIINSNLIDVEDVRQVVMQANQSIEEATGIQNAFLINSNGDVMYTINEDVNYYSGYARQYIQHNPASVKSQIKPTSNRMKALAEVNGVTLVDRVENESIDKFIELESEEPYLVLLTSKGKPLLFEKRKTEDLEDGSIATHYQRIPTLGNYGFNEYNSVNDVNESMVQDNNPTVEFEDSPMILSISDEIAGNRELEIKTIGQYIEETLNSPDNKYYDMVETFKDFFVNGNDISISFSSEIPGAAQYVPATFDNNGELMEQAYILVNEEYAKNASMSELDDKVMEEIIHHLTVSTINDYVNITAINADGTLVIETKGKPIPASLQTVLNLYQEGLQHYIQKYGSEALFAKMAPYTQDQNAGPNSLTISEEDALVAYRLSDIHEFIAGLFIKDSQFANEMRNTISNVASESILESFAKAFFRFLSKIAPNNIKKYITGETAKSLYDFLAEHHETAGNKLRQVKKVDLGNTDLDAAAKKVLNKNTNFEATEEDVEGDIDPNAPIPETKDISNLFDRLNSPLIKIKC